MDFLYVFTWIFLSLFGLVMLLKTAADALLDDEKEQEKTDRDRFREMGVGQKRR